MMYFKEGGKWYPIHINHYAYRYVHRLMHKLPLKIQGIVYTKEGPELYKALESERIWQNLSEKG